MNVNVQFLKTEMVNLEPVGEDLAIPSVGHQVKWELKVKLLQFMARSKTLLWYSMVQTQG